MTSAARGSPATCNSVLVFAFVLGFAFALLLYAFRSLVIATTAVMLNLVSVAAAYGLLVSLFQWGRGERVFGFHSTHSIAAWPLFLFVILCCRG